MYTMKLTALEGSFSLTCPHCGHVNLTATADTLAVDGGFVDGDTVLGLRKRLAEAGLITPGTDKSRYYSLVIGYCHGCGGLYFALTLTMIDSSAELDDAWFSTYCLLNAEPEVAPAYMQGSFEGDASMKPWLVTVYQTSKGVALEHTFGLFSAKEDLEGPNGVSACGDSSATWEFARQFLFDAWPAASALAAKVYKEGV